MEYIHIKGPGNLKLDVSISLQSTVGDLKNLLQTKTSIPSDTIRLIFLGNVLTSEDQTLSHYGITPDSTIHFVVSRTSQGTDASASVQSTQSQEMDRLMASMMDSPLFQQMFENPELMEGMMMNNPQVQQILQNNPEFRAVFSDPTMLRQAMRSMQNPNLRREMMRNADRAMANIENLPGGFDALQRIHQTIQDPMLDAMTQPHPEATLQPSSQPPGVDPSRPTVTPLPNPWNRSTPSFPFMGTPSMNPFSLFPSPQQSQPQTDMFQQMMQQMMENPQLMQQALGAFPMGGAGVPAVGGPVQDPVAAMTQQLMSNPELMQQLLDPQNLQAMSGLMQSTYGGGMGMAPGVQGMGFPGLGFPGMGLPMGFPGMGLPVPETGLPVTAPVPPVTQRFAIQLQQLKDMGFTDAQKNMEALEESSGNVDQAVERLVLGGQ